MTLENIRERLGPGTMRQVELALDALINGRALTPDQRAVLAIWRRIGGQDAEETLAYITETYAPPSVKRPATA
jgi:hypothetical protein